MADVRKKVKGTEYVLVWVAVGEEVLKHNYIDTIDFDFVSPEELKDLNRPKKKKSN